MPNTLNPPIHESPSHKTIPSPPSTDSDKIIVVKYSDTVMKGMKFKVNVVEKPVTESRAPVLKQEVEEKAEEPKEGKSSLRQKRNSTEDGSLGFENGEFSSTRL
ncbi:unnamed protein product [Linum trigynum]|uniref:Uncharacterized protein n=1 Tax=Linum trigynum TaxID=586398 RepID=A0AAV2CM51_9ROSI